MMYVFSSSFETVDENNGTLVKMSQLMFEGGTVEPKVAKKNSKDGPLQLVGFLPPPPGNPEPPIAHDTKCIYLFCGNFSLENACFVCTFCTSNFFAVYETYVGNNVGWIGIFARALDNCHGIQCIPIHLFPIAI